MRGYTKLLILVVVFAVLLVAVLMVQRSTTSQTRQVRLAQTAPMFPGLKEENIFRFEVNTLQNDSLLFRKQAGVWEVAMGKDVMSEIMQRSEEQRIEPSAEEGETPQDGEAAPEEEAATSAAQGEPEVQPAEPEAPTPPPNPRNDPAPAADPFRTFYTADPDMVQKMIDAIVDLPQGQLVTTDTTKQASLGVLSAIVGIEVAVYDQQMNELARVIIGNQGPGFVSTYVRKPDSDETYQVPANLPITFGTKIINMRDRTLFRISPETFSSLSVENLKDSQGFNLLRSEGIWTGADLAGNVLQLDPAKVDNLLSTLGSLSASSFIDPNVPPQQPPNLPDWDPNDPYGFRSFTGIVEFTTADNVTHTINFGKLQGTTYSTAIDGRLNDVIRISGTTVDSILIDPADLAPGEESTETAATPTGEGLQPGDTIDLGEAPGGN